MEATEGVKEGGRDGRREGRREGWMEGGRRKGDGLGTVKVVGVTKEVREVSAPRPSTSYIRLSACGSRGSRQNHVDYFTSRAK